MRRFMICPELNGEFGKADFGAIPIICGSIDASKGINHCAFEAIEKTAYNIAIERMKWVLEVEREVGENASGICEGIRRTLKELGEL